MYLYPNAVNYTNGGSNTMNSLSNAGSVPLRKRRPITIGRRKRNIDFYSIYNNETMLSPQEEILNSFGPGKMYSVMIQCAEDYIHLY